MTLKLAAIVCSWLLLSVSLAGPTSQPESDYVIDQYAFTWTVLDTGRVKMEITKTPDHTLVWLRTSGLGMSLSLLPAEAAALAPVLADTTRHHRQMAGQPNQHRSVKAGGHVVSFGTTDKGSFYVSLRQDREFAMSSLLLDRQDAGPLAEKLSQSVAMVRFVDARIRP